LGKEFVEYAESLGEGFKSVSGDVWGMLLEFIETVGEDLKGWNEMDACKFFFSLQTFFSYECNRGTDEEWGRGNRAKYN